MSKSASAIVAKMQSAWAAAFTCRDFAGIVEFYDKRALFFGSAPGLCDSPTAIRAYFDALPPGLALTDFPALEVRAISPDVIVASGDWTFALDGARLDFRLAWTLVRCDGHWRIVQHHASRRPEKALAKSRPVAFGQLT